MTIEMATFGGGCFWCTEAVFQQLRGVKSVDSGYSGGTLESPSSEQVSEGNSGHAEVVRLSFDSSLVSYRTLLEIFFATHDPTTLHRQGSDVGSQYRSIIFTHSEEQDAMAQKVMNEIACVWDAPLVTELRSAPQFYLAEEYHQNYFKLNGHQSYCSLVVAPKVQIAREYARVSAAGPARGKKFNYSGYMNAMLN
ncbi:peptide-methionine (S)-S-oxide reductase MsrA [Undibacterium sp. Ren11W]|uniref:peptide-methionine (S)-S-oxide reductase MsrA n=1 Tax=Undibacterium sp. Ren11W TaxID=3413045 RepID=UPI003BF149AC